MSMRNGEINVKKDEQDISKLKIKFRVPVFY